MNVRDAYVLASVIEENHARDRCTLNGRFRLCRGPNARVLRRQAVAAEYDPLAATELAEMILRYADREARG